MNYLILSPMSLSLFIVPRLNKIKEVEKIYFCSTDPAFKTSGKDMENLPNWNKLELVADYNKVLNEVKKEDLIIFIDDVGLGETGKNLRKQGYKVIGGSPFTDKIEDERQFATDLMSRIMDVPPSTSFDSFEAGLQFVKSQDKTARLVFKPNDSAVPKEYTYVSKDVNDMVQAMQAFKAEWKWKESFQIQEFIKGAEVDFSAYLGANGEYIDNSLVIYFENKPIMNDDIGPATGGAIAAEFCHPPEGIFWEILQKLKPALVKAGYIGQISVNSIVSEKDHKPYFLEFCGRVGYPSFPLDITILEDNGHTLHELFTALVNGVNAKNLFKPYLVAITASVFVPPAPNASVDDMTQVKGTPISWDPQWDIYFWPYYVMWDKKMVLTGTSSWVLQVSCADETLDGAKQMLYETYFPTLQLKNAMYRTDAGSSAKKRIKALKEYGVLKGQK